MDETPTPQPDDTPAVQPAPAATATGGKTGPIGETRSIGLSILWFIITLGIYGIYWTYKTIEEMKRHTGDGIGGVVGIVIYLVIGPVLWFVIPSEVGQMHKRAGQDPPVTGITGLWWLLPIVGAFVWFFKVQGALNRYWETARHDAGAVAG
jgi:amino acid transporter